MMRRLIRNQVHRPCRREFSKTCSKTSFVPGAASIGCRYSSRESLVGNHQDVDTTTSTTTQFFPTASRGCFEIKDISARQLSSEAIRSLAPGGDGDYFQSATCEDVVINPFLRGGRAKETVAPLELLQAISTLQHRYLLDVEHNSGENDSVSAKYDPNGEDEPVVNQNDTFATDEELPHVQTKDDLNDIDSVRKRIKEELDTELREGRNSTRRYKIIVNVFNEERSSAHELLDDQQLSSMFHFLVNNDILLSYEVLKYYAERCKEKGRVARLDMYQRVINRIRPYMHYDATKPESKSRRMKLKELIGLVLDVTQHIQEEYSEGKKKVYQFILLPELVQALSENKNCDIKSLATPIMNYILEHKFPVLNPELYECLLLSGRRSEIVQDVFPYHKVLSELVSSGHVPKPEAVVTALQCYHPFNDTNATHQILSIIQELQLSNADSLSPIDDFRIDLGTLEAISMASARKNVDLGLLVWDLVEQFGYSPTASMFEDVIMSFAATIQDKNLYSALADMERNGFEPSPTLLKFVAMKISYDKNDKRIRHSYNMITWRGNSHMMSKHCMNILILGHGMRRDINNAFFVFEEFARLNLKPDANTFSFLMEALYIDTKSRFPFEAGQQPKCNPQDVNDVIAAVQIVLDSIGESGVKKTKSFYYEHIRLLYTLSLLEEAKFVLEEAISTGTPVPMNTLFMLASKFALLGDFESARAVSGLSIAAGCGDFPRLVNRIRNLENSFNGVGKGR